MDSRIETVISDFSTEIQKLGIEIDTLVLFGSQSDGTAKDGSDVDLAIISPTFKGFSSLERRIMIKSALYKIIDSHQIPLDLILLTPDEYKTEKSLRVSFIRQGTPVPCSQA